MAKRFIFVVLLVFGYCLFLAITFPAIHAYKIFHHLAPELQPSNLSGTIWNMNATNLKIGNWMFHSSEGSLQLLPLLAGKISFNVNLKRLSIRTSSNIKLISDQEVKFTHLKASLPAYKVATWLKKSNTIQGQLVFKMKHFTWFKRSKFIRSAEGRVEWHKAIIGDKNTGQLKLGKISFDIKSYGKVIKAKIKNTNSAILVSGELVIKDNGSYSLFAKLAAKNKADLKTKAFIKQIGKTDNKGQYHFRMRGRI